MADPLPSFTRRRRARASTGAVAPIVGLATPRTHDGPSLSSVVEGPVLLTPNEVAQLLRTTRRAVYAMLERGQLPGAVRLGRRVLFDRHELLHWLHQKRASSLQE